MKKLYDGVQRFCAAHPRFGIPNLMRIIVIGNVAVYVLMLLTQANDANALSFLTFNLNALLHGEVWRLVTWVIVPPTSSSGMFGLFGTLITLYFYWSIGSTLEQVWGTYRYNVYLLSGILFTIVGSFVAYGCAWTFYADKWGLNVASNAEVIFNAGSTCFSTYYITMSLFLAFAATFPNAQVLLMFFIPLKVKWLGVMYGVIILFEFFQSSVVNFYTEAGAVVSLDFGIFVKISILFSLLNFILFFITSRSKMSMNPRQVKRQQEFKRDVKRNTYTSKVTKHKCAICGRTDESNPELEFRFCSKCNGNYEYCQDHLFTHEHVK